MLVGLVSHALSLWFLGREKSRGRFKNETDLGMQKGQLWAHATLNDALQVLCLVAQQCPTLCSPTNRRGWWATVHGILQAKILEWVTKPSLMCCISLSNSNTWVSQAFYLVQTVNHLDWLVSLQSVKKKGVTYWVYFFSRASKWKWSDKINVVF